MSKTATVRSRPKLASRRNSRHLAAVIYLGGEWIGQKVKVVPEIEWRRLNNRLRTHDTNFKKMKTIQERGRRRLDALVKRLYK